MNINKKALNIAKNYANAVLNIAKSQKTEKKIFEQLINVSKIINSSEDLKLFMENPLISSGDKKDVIFKVFGKNFDLQIINLLNILADNKRLELFDTVLYCYEDLYEKEENISKVTIISAVEMNEATKLRLENVLSKKLNAKIMPEYKIKSDIIGGLVINIKDTIIDLSLKEKIKKMEKQLI